jgi:hypothetical protein
MGVGAMAGAGIFALLGEAGAIAGIAVWISFLITGAIALVQGYSFAKLGTRYSTQGGTIEFLVQGFGNGHVTGIVSWLFYLVGQIIEQVVADRQGAGVEPTRQEPNPATAQRSAIQLLSTHETDFVPAVY